MMKVLRALLILALTFHAPPAWVAETKAPGQAEADRRRLQEWISKLAGQFSLEGSLESAGDSGSSERLSIRGQADCRGIRAANRAFALASGVECFMDIIREPQHTPTAQHSATLLYAIDRTVPGIRHMQVDDEGVAEGGTARLDSDTLFSESPCARIPGKCLRKVRIIEPDRQSLKLEVDIEVDGKRVSRQQLTLHRQTVSP